LHFASANEVTIVPAKERAIMQLKDPAKKRTNTDKIIESFGFIGGVLEIN